MQEVLALSPSPVVIGGVSCNSGEKDGVAAPPVGTRVSCFERSLLEPNSARLLPGPEGNMITLLIPGQRSPRVFPGWKGSDTSDVWRDRVDVWRDRIDVWRDRIDVWRDRIDFWRDRIDVWRDRCHVTPFHRVGSILSSPL